MNAKNVNDPPSRRAGGKPPRFDKPGSKNSKLGEAYDWREPWLNTLKFCNILSAHAAGVVVIAGFAELLEIVLTSMSQTPLVWTVRGITITLSDIVHFRLHMPGLRHLQGWELDTKPFTWECAGCHRQTSVTAER